MVDTVLKKHELEGKLGEESRMIKSGLLRDENPLDDSDEFNDFLLACRQNNLRRCQELISQGVNINGKDPFDYTPLIVASLCGHFELVQLLLESGALAERNTFQGERCIYNALNDRIRNLLLQYDFSKSSDPYVYWSTHISTLLNRSVPSTSDITLTAGSSSLSLHKFLLSLRTPYFREKLKAQPETTTWNLAASVPVEAFQIALRYVYLGDLPKDLVPPGSFVSEEEVAKGLDKISKQLEIDRLWEAILSGGDRRLARQRYQDEVERALGQVREFFEANVLGHKMVVDSDRVGDVKWKHDNSIFADVLLRADEPLVEDGDGTDANQGGVVPAIPIGPASASTESKKPRRSILYPVHKAMLIRSEYFVKMFSGDFLEAKKSEHLKVITMDCTPAVLEIILTFLYTENAACPLEHALDLLYAADMLFLDTLKTRAAQAISTLGSGTANTLVDRTHAGTGETETVEMEPVNIYDVIHAAWDLRVQRLEEFAARYLASRLEDYIDEPDFQDLIEESASRLQSRQETDTIELLDDIRYYLSERFRLRFEDAGLDEMLDENGELSLEAAATIVAQGNEAESGERPIAAEQPTVADKPIAVETSGVAPPKTKAEPRPQNSDTVTDATAQTDSTVVALNGEEVEDEFASDAINYQILLGKIDIMLDRLKLDA